SQIMSERAETVARSLPSGDSAELEILPGWRKCRLAKRNRAPVGNGTPSPPTCAGLPPRACARPTSIATADKGKRRSIACPPKKVPPSASPFDEITTYCPGTRADCNYNAGDGGTAEVTTSRWARPTVGALAISFATFTLVSGQRSRE